MSHTLTEAEAAAQIDHRAPWTANPFARSILATCAAKPPRCVERRQRYAITEDSWHEYIGPRADALRAIRQRYGQAKVEALDAGEDVLFHDGSWPTVEEAIDAVIESALVGDPQALTDTIHRIAGGR